MEELTNNLELRSSAPSQSNKNRNVYEKGDSGREQVYPITRTSAVYLTDGGTLSEKLDYIDAKLLELDGRVGGIQSGLGSIKGQYIQKEFLKLIEALVPDATNPDFIMNITEELTPKDTISGWIPGTIPSILETDKLKVFRRYVLCIKDGENEYFAKPYEIGSPSRVFGDNNNVDVSGQDLRQIYSLRTSQPSSPTDLIGRLFSSLPLQNNVGEWCRTDGMKSNLTKASFKNYTLYGCDVRLEFVDGAFKIKEVGTPYPLEDANSYLYNSVIYMDRNDEPSSKADAEKLIGVKISSLKFPWSNYPHKATTEEYKYVYQISVSVDSELVIREVVGEWLQYAVYAPESDSQVSFMSYPTLYTILSDNVEDDKLDDLVNNIVGITYPNTEYIINGNIWEERPIPPTKDKPYQFYCLVTAQNGKIIKHWGVKRGLIVTLHTGSEDDPNGERTKSIIRFSVYRNIAKSIKESPAKPTMLSNANTYLNMSNIPNLSTLIFTDGNGNEWSGNTGRQAEYTRWKCTVILFLTETIKSDLTTYDIEFNSADVPEEDSEQAATMGERGVLGQACRIRSVATIKYQFLQDSNAKIWAFPPGDTTNYYGRSDVNPNDVSQKDTLKYAKFYDVILDDTNIGDSKDPQSVKYYIAKGTEGFAIHDTIFNGDNVVINPTYWEAAQQYNFLVAQSAIIDNLTAKTVNAERILTYHKNGGNIYLDAGMLNGQEAANSIKDAITGANATLPTDKTTTDVVFFAGNSTEGFNVTNANEINLHDSNLYITKDGTLHAKRVIITDDNGNEWTELNIIGGKVETDIEVKYHYNDDGELSNATLEVVSWGSFQTYKQCNKQYQYKRFSYYKKGTSGLLDPILVTYEGPLDISVTEGVPGPQGPKGDTFILNVYPNVIKANVSTSISAELFQITYDEEGNLSRNRITGSVTFLYKYDNNTDWASLTSSPITVSKSLDVRALYGGITVDSQSIGVISSTGITVVNDNSNHTLTTNKQGYTNNFTGCGCNIYIYNGENKLYPKAVLDDTGTFKYTSVTVEGSSIDTYWKDNVKPSEISYDISNRCIKIKDGFYNFSQVITAFSTVKFTFTLTYKIGNIEGNITTTQTFSKAITGADGLPGPASTTPGPAGKIMRLRKFDSTVEMYFYNQMENSNESNDLEENAGKTYWDVVTVINNDETGVDYYRCISPTTITVGSTKTAITGDRTHFTPATQYNFLQADTIIAKTVSTEVAEANKFLVKGNLGNGEQIVAGMLGNGLKTNDNDQDTDSGEVRIFAGSNKPTDAPFTVNNNGKLIATDAEITGAIHATSGEFTGNVEATTFTVINPDMSPYFKIEFDNVGKTLFPPGSTVSKNCGPGVYLGMKINTNTWNWLPVSALWTTYNAVSNGKQRLTVSVLTYNSGSDSVTSGNIFYDEDNNKYYASSSGTNVITLGTYYIHDSTRRVLLFSTTDTKGNTFVMPGNIVYKKITVENGVRSDSSEDSDGYIIYDPMYYRYNKETRTVSAVSPYAFIGIDITLPGNHTYYTHETQSGGGRNDAVIVKKEDTYEVHRNV